TTLHSSFLHYTVAHRDLHSFPTRRSSDLARRLRSFWGEACRAASPGARARGIRCERAGRARLRPSRARRPTRPEPRPPESDNLRSEEHTSELQSRFDLVCRLLLEKKKEHK